MKLPRISPPRIEPAQPGARLDLRLPGSTEGGPFARWMQHKFEGFHAERWKQCSYCAERVRREAVVCKHCGRDLDI